MIAYVPHHDTTPPTQPPQAVVRTADCKYQVVEKYDRYNPIYKCLNEEEYKKYSEEQKRLEEERRNDPSGWIIVGGFLLAVALSCYVFVYLPSKYC